MGGAGYIFAGEHDANVMLNPVTINLNMAYHSQKAGEKKIFNEPGTKRNDKRVFRNFRCKNI